MRYKQGDKVSVGIVWKKVDGKLRLKRNEVFTVVSYDERDGWVHCVPRPEVTTSNIFHVKALRRVA